MNRAAAVRALVLDFDGVIIESNALKTTAFERVFARYPDHTAAMMAYHHAHVSESRFAKFRHLATLLGRSTDDAVVEELGERFSAEMLQLIDACPFVPGAPEFLARFQGRLPMYLASVTPEDELRVIVERRALTSYFARVYGCPPWTKPGAIAEIAGEHGGPDALLFVGDSAGDQRAAAATGVTFIARDSGLPFDEPRPPSYPNLFAIADLIEARL